MINPSVILSTILSLICLALALRLIIKNKKIGSIPLRQIGQLQNGLCRTRGTVFQTATSKFVANNGKDAVLKVVKSSHKRGNKRRTDFGKDFFGPFLLHDSTGYILVDINEHPGFIDGHSSEFPFAEWNEKQLLPAETEAIETQLQNTILAPFASPKRIVEELIILNEEQIYVCGHYQPFEKPQIIANKKVNGRIEFTQARGLGSVMREENAQSRSNRGVIVAFLLAAAFFAFLTYGSYNKISLIKK